MIFLACVLGICALSLVSAHLMAFEYYECMIVYQVYALLLCGAAYTSTASARDRSVLAVLLFWAMWVLVTDHYGLNLPDFLLSYESAFFTALIAWCFARPYTLRGDQLTTNTVCLAFYQGRRAPLLSEIASIIGLPFSSFAIVAGERMIRVRHRKELHVSKPCGIDNNDYVIIDTGVPVTDEIRAAIDSLSGVRVSPFSCVASLRPILALIEITPRFNMPSLFYYQVVRHGNVRR